MNESQIAQFKAVLECMRTELSEDNARGEAGQKTVTLDQQAVGRLSRMDALQNQAMAKATQARRDGMEARIKAALTRMDEGEYGYCLDCGEEIAFKRLELDPTIPLCLSCAAG